MTQVPQEFIDLGSAWSKALETLDSDYIFASLGASATQLVELHQQETQGTMADSAEYVLRFFADCFENNLQSSPPSSD